MQCVNMRLTAETEVMAEWCRSLLFIYSCYPAIYRSYLALIPELNCHLHRKVKNINWQNFCTSLRMWLHSPFYTDHLLPMMLDVIFSGAECRISFIQRKYFLPLIWVMTSFFECREANSVMQFKEWQLLGICFVSCQAYGNNTKLLN